MRVKDNMLTVGGSLQIHICPLNVMYYLWQSTISHSSAKYITYMISCL